MANQSVPIVPRGRRDEVHPPAPLDPYVTAFLRWVETRENRPNPNRLAKQAASDLGWPLPFAEAIVTATRARRLLTLVAANARGGFRIGLTRRGHAWLERSLSTPQPSLE